MKDYRNYPYGAYLADGSTVIFNRWYQPIVRLTQPPFPASGEPAVTACDPTERIEHSGQEWFYSDVTSPRRSSETRKRLQALLAAIPQLAAEVRRRGSRRRTTVAA